MEVLWGSGCRTQGNNNHRDLKPLSRSKPPRETYAPVTKSSRGHHRPLKRPQTEHDGTIKRHKTTKTKHDYQETQNNYQETKHDYQQHDCQDAKQNTRLNTTIKTQNMTMKRCNYVLVCIDLGAFICVPTGTLCLHVELVRTKANTPSC